VAAWINSRTLTDDAEALDEFFGGGEPDWSLKVGDLVYDPMTGKS